MTTDQTSSRSLRALAGAILFALGMLLLFANLDAVADNLSHSSTTSAGALGSIYQFSLAGLRAAQAYFFDHPSFQAGVRQILLSCWPLLLVMIGAALLQHAAGRNLANPPARLGPSGTGERN